MAAAESGNFAAISGMLDQCDLKFTPVETPPPTERRGECTSPTKTGPAETRPELEAAHAMAVLAEGQDQGSVQQKQSSLMTGAAEVTTSTTIVI